MRPRAARPAASAQASPAALQQSRAGPVCRMHGAGGGAPSGKRNGRYMHGGRTKETMALMAEMRDLVRDSRELLEAIE